MKSGAYGFALQGLDAADLLVPAPASWPLLQVRVETGRARVERDRFGPDHAELRLRTVDGSVALDRRAMTVVFTVPDGIGPAALVHPFLASPALVAAHWLGRETFHAGAFVVGDGAWAVLGEKGDGKSTLMAWLARRGAAVVTDDVLIVDAGSALAGPRSIDLRGDSARRLGIGEALGLVGTRRRWRVRTGPVAAAVPLAGWVVLAWDDRAPPAVKTVRGAARLATIGRHRGVHLLPIGDGEPLLALAGLPVFELDRPRDWASADESGERLLAAVGA